MTGISPRAIATAKAVLAKCNAVDPWFPRPAEYTVMAWAEQFMLTNLDREDLLDGVTLAYQQHGSGFRPLPADIIGTARAIRHDRFQRRPLADIEAHNDRTDERLAPLITELGEAHSVNQVLKYRRPTINPLRVQCPYPPCHASVGRPCTSGGVPLRKEPRYHPARVEAAAPPKSPEDGAWPTCTACGTHPLVTDDDVARGVCTPCQQATTPQQPKTEAPEGNTA